MLSAAVALGLLAATSSLAAAAVQGRPPPASAPFANTSAIAESSPLLSSASSRPVPIQTVTDATNVTTATTATTSLSNSTITAPSLATSPGSSHGNRTQPTSAPCTVNIPRANLEWWYLATYQSAAGRFETWSANVTNAADYLTLVPNTDTFDVSSTISAEFAWTPTVISDQWGVWTDYDVYPVTPTAATTSIVTRNGARPVPSGNIIPASDARSYMLTTDLPPATVTIPGKANATSAITSATPFLYFDAYEIESVSNGTTATSTISLAEPSATEYWIKGIEDSASASGAVPDEFLQHIGHATCSPGTVQGEVTVLIVVDIVWLHMSTGNPLLVHFESSELGFETTDDMAVAAGETSTNQLFTANPGNPKWTEDLGKTTQDGSGPKAQPTMPQPGQETILSNVLQPTQHTVGSVGAIPIIVGPSSAVVVGSQTLQPGASAITIGSTLVSLAPSATAIVVDGTTSALPIVANPGSPSQSVGTVGGRPIVVDSTSAIIIGTATLTPGQPAVTIGGTVVSVASPGTAIVVGGMTSTLPQVIFPAEPIQTQPPPPPVLTVGSSAFTANAATQFFLGPGQTLTPGGTATLDGTIVSLGPSASFVVIGGTTQNLQSSAPTFRPEIVIGGTTITALPASPSGQHGLENQANNAPGPSFVVSGQTLVPGHAVTVDGTTISLAPSGSFIVVNGVTSTLPQPGTGPTPGPAHATITNPPVLTIGSQTITAMPGSGTTFVISGQTLTPGGTITVDGTTVSLAPGATELVYGSAGRSTTEALFPATTTRITSGSAPASAGPSSGSEQPAVTSKTGGVGRMLPVGLFKSWVSSLMVVLLVRSLQ